MEGYPYSEILYVYFRKKPLQVLWGGIVLHNHETEKPEMTKKAFRR